MTSKSSGLRPTIHRRNCVLYVLTLNVLLVSSPLAFGQHIEISALAVKAAHDLDKKKIKAISVAFFRNDKGGVSEAGRLLAMEFSAALAKADPQIQIIDPARLKVLAAERHLLPSDVFNSEVARQLSTSLGAAAQFRGIIKSSGSSLKLDLELVDAVGRLKYDGHGGFNPERLGKSSATLVQSSELTSQLSRANSEDTSGFLIAGTPGTTYATCGDCPPPQFEREAGHDIPEGLVLILITVTPDGKVVDPFILGGGAAGLETATIEAIKKWRFIPARDANGRPGTMRMEIGLRHTR